MPLSAWRKWWRRSAPRSQKLRKKPYSRKCFLELLEDRTLLSNTYTVDLVTDNVINTGQQNGPSSGDLRWCIVQADQTPGSTIVFDPTIFPASSNTTIKLLQGELPISASMKIEGPGAGTVTVSGDASGSMPQNGTVASRVFDISSSQAVVTIAGLTITGGNAAPNSTSLAGNQGGDIFNGGNLTLQNDIVENGFSLGAIGGPNGRGGAIYNAEGQGNTVLALDNTIVENNLARGPNGANHSNTAYWPSADPNGAGGPGGPAQGGGIYNDVTALLIVEDGSQILGNTALGGDGGNAGHGFTPSGNGVPGGNGGDGGAGGLAEGGAIYNGGKLQIIGNSVTSILLSDNSAQGGKGGFGGNGSNGNDGKAGGRGGNSGGGGSGGDAEGGGIFNTGSGPFPSTVTLQNVSFLGEQAIGGAGNIGGIAGNGGKGTTQKLGTGGHGGSGGGGGAGGNAQGGAIYTAWGSLTVPKVLFGEDANGVSDQALGGAGSNGGAGGNGGGSTGNVLSGVGNPGGAGGDGGAGGNGGFAKGGIVANVLNGGNVAFTNDTFDSGLARGGNGGTGGNAGAGGQGAAADKNATKSTHSAAVGGQGGRGGDGGAGGAAVGGSVFNSVGSLTITSGVFLSSQALAGTGGNAGAGGTGGQGGNGTSKGAAFTGGVGGTGGTGGQGGAAQGGAFYNMVGAVTITTSQFKARTAGGIGNEAMAGSGGNGGAAGAGGIGGDTSSTKGFVIGGTGGNGGTAGIAGNGGLAEGGAGGNQGGATTLTGDIFTSSLVKSGSAGNGGDGGKGGDGGNGANHNADGIGGNGSDGASGGNAGTAWGGAIVDKAGNLTISTSTFGGGGPSLGNQVVGGNAGSGGIGGGWGHWGHRGSAAYEWRTSSAPFAGNGGHGGLGAFVYGGALSVSNNGQTVQITNTTFTNSSISAGNGGNGGQGGLDSIDGANKGINGTGGDGGLAQGGAVSLSVSASQNATLNNVTIASSSATGGNGGDGNINDLATVDALIPGYNGYGSPAGNGGSVNGVGLAAINYSLNISNGSFNGGTGQGGKGGQGGTINPITEPYTYAGGAGGNAGSVYGGGVFFSNTTGNKLNLTFNSGGASNNKLTGGAGGNGGFAGGFGNKYIAGGAGGNAGAVEGGGIYIVAGNTSINTIALSNLTLDGNAITGGTGGVGGAGYNAPGGTGGLAYGAGVYNSSSNGSKASSLTVSGSTFAGDEATGGIGGDAGSGTTPNGGDGGAGGNAGNAEGAGLYNGFNTPLTVVNSTFGGGSTNSTQPLANANVLIGNRGGRGGDAGTPKPVPSANGGAGGSGSIIQGANVYIASNAANFINDTIVDGQAMSPGLGGAGGSGAGNGGQNGIAGQNGVGLAGGYFAAPGSTNQVGNTILDLNNALSGVVEPFSSFGGLTYNSSGGNTPPDTQGAAGPSSYVETVSQAVGLFNKSTGATLVPVDSLTDFWTNQGKLARADAGSTFANPTVIWDEQIQRFIIAEQDVDTTTHVSVFDIAVSTSARPGTLTSADWNFFQVTTTESGFDAENPGSLGWNHDALVFTLNMVNPTTGAIDHVQVNTISITALVNNNKLVEGTNAFQTDFAGANLRPTVMHDSKAGGPMWFMEESGTDKSINVVEMTNLLTTSPAFTTTSLGVTPYSKAVAPLQPGGSAVTNNIDSSIQKVAEQNGLLVAAQTVSDQAGNEDNIQWYVVDVSSGTPQLQQEGDVSGGPGVYDAFPSIDINSQGTIGMTYLHSGTSAGQYVSMYVTGRLAADLPGTMAAPVLVQAGKQATLAGTGEGDVSSISVDSDGSFWAANEYANTLAGANWGTYIDHFNLANTPDVYGSFTSLGYNILGSTFKSTGFNTSVLGKDTIANATELNIGPLLNNGGPTSTDALLDNGTGKSVAIDAGGNTLVTNPANPWYNLFGFSATDQRGPGFPRLDLANNAVDVGAYELNFPIITSLNPPSAVEQGPAFTLTIDGTGFVAGATVSFGGTTLIPSSITSTQIMVTVPANLLPDEGTVNVTVSIPDGSGVTGEVLTSAAVTFQITEGATIQLTGPGDQTNNESDTLTTADGIVVTSSDPDTTFSSTTLPPGLSIDPNTGLITGTINPYAVTNGQPSQTFSVTVYGTDDGIVRGSVTFNWTVNDTTPPTLSGPSGTLNFNEGQTLSATNKNTITISATDADPGTFTDQVNGKDTLPPGLSIDPNTGVISGTISSTAANNSPYNVVINASDNGTVSPNPVKFSIVVADTTPPTVSPIANQTNNEGDTNIDLQVTAPDADNFSISGLPGGLTYSTQMGLISGTIGLTAAQNSPYTVTVIAYDNGYASQPVQFSWTVKDTQPPTLTGPTSPPTNNEGDNITPLTITATDNASNFTATGLPTGLTISSSGVISGTISPNAVTNGQASQTFNVTVSAQDAAGNVGNVKFNWTVADTTAPTVSPIANQSNNEGATITPLDINAPDADSFQISGLPSGLTYNTTTGVISGTVGQYVAGSYTVQVIAIDNGNKSQPVSFTWTVNDTNPPTLTGPLSPPTNNEGDTISPLTILATDNASNFTAAGLPTGLSINAYTGVISGTIDRYAVTNGQASQTFAVTVNAQDAAGNVGSVQFTWTVNDTTPPTLTNPQTQNNNEGDTVTLQIQAADADPGSFTATGLPTGLSINAQTGLISGTISAYAVNNSQPSQAFNVTVSANDGTGNAGSVQFTWNVADTTPPSFGGFNPGDQTNDEGDSVTLNIGQNVTDADSYSATGLPSGLSINKTTGAITGTISNTAAESSPYTVTVYAYDNGNSASITFQWKVIDSAPPSFTNPGDQISSEGQTVSVATNPVGADPGTIQAIGLPTGLSIDSNTGLITGTIDKHAAGTYHVSISGNDNGHSAGFTFQWTVNDTTPPTLTNPGAQNNYNGTAINVAIHASDADAGTFTATGLPAGLSLDPNTGVISGTLFASPGTYHVNVAASDSGHGASITFPWVVNQPSTTSVITSVTNTYTGFFQVETVTAEVTDPQGLPVNDGFVTFQVNDQTVVAPVVNGFASATIVTNMFALDLTVLMNDLFTHSLDAVYSDPAGIFGSASGSVAEPGMLLDFLLFLQNAQFGSLVPQLNQLQNS